MPPYHFQMCLVKLLSTSLCLSYIYADRSWASWMADPYFNSDMYTRWCKPSFAKNVCKLPSYCTDSIAYQSIWCQCKSFLCIWKSLFSSVCLQWFYLNVCLILIHQHTKTFEASHESVRVSVKSHLTAITAKFQTSRDESCAAANSVDCMSHCVWWFSENRSCNLFQTTSFRGVLMYITISFESHT